MNVDFARKNAIMRTSDEPQKKRELRNRFLMFSARLGLLLSEGVGFCKVHHETLFAASESSNGAMSGSAVSNVMMTCDDVCGAS